MDAKEKDDEFKLKEEPKSGSFGFMARVFRSNEVAIDSRDARSQLRIVKHPILIAVVVLFLHAKLLRYLFYYLADFAIFSGSDHTNVLSSLNVAYWLVFLVILFSTILPVNQVSLAKYIKLMVLQLVGLTALTGALYVVSKLLALPPKWGPEVSMSILLGAVLIGFVMIVLGVKRENDEFLTVGQRKDDEPLELDE